MKYKFIYLFILCTTISILSACSQAGGQTTNENYLPSSVTQNNEYGLLNSIGDDVAISRALAARMIALAFSNINDINWADRVISFSDTLPNFWYDKYINMVYTLGFLSGDGYNFFPHNPLTLEQAQHVLDRINPNNSIRIQLTDENRLWAISYALWVELFVQTLQSISNEQDLQAGFGLDIKNVIVLITAENNSLLSHGHIITSTGHMHSQGFAMGSYIDKEITVLTKENHILAILDVYNYSPIIYNAYIVNVNYNNVSIFSGGAQRSYPLQVNELTAHATSGSIADIRLVNGYAEIMNTNVLSVSGVIQQVNYDAIALENHGILPTHSDFKIYNTMDVEVSWGNLSNLVIGYNVADFVIRDGKILAAIISRRPTPEHIRVVLSTTGFGGYLHSTVELFSPTGFSLYMGEHIQEFYPNQRLTLSPLENTHFFTTEYSNRIIIVPKNEGKTEIASITRNWPSGQSPQYRGIIEITRREHGFVIVNQINIEQYLYAVIPSEMPTSFGLVAAKVQAITARSYAYNQFFANRFYAYGGNVDDSTASQVYNNTPETELAIMATNETRGKLLTYRGSVINANFFSTSAGITANSSDVWINMDTLQFDRQTPPYLRSVRQYLNSNFGDLSQEDNAYIFFTNTEIESYDDNSPWFRWNFFVTNSQLSNIINTNVSRIYNQSPQLVKTLNDFGQFISSSINSIGNFQSMSVYSRGEGGNIRELVITGSENTILVRTEYLIRHLLAPIHPDGIVLNLHNSSPITNNFMLPSTFMTFYATQNGVNFFGGGFGHGVGMSQHGVLGMVNRGYDYIDILSHFYPGAVLSTTN